jgi:uncharacterized protein
MLSSSPELSQIRPRLQAAFPDRLRGVLLFGSVARREADSESDLDLLVLLDGPIRLGRICARSFRPSIPCSLATTAPSMLSPVAADVFDAGRYALYRNAKAEGIFL